VLCLDDDSVIARMVADVVRYCGHEPIVEIDSMTAIVKYARSDISVAIVDQMMPKVDGVEVLAAFMEGSPRCRRVMLTASPDEQAVREAVQMGIIQLLIAKPPALNDLRSAMLWL
jgi:DNA-binding NtrC family response regulator